MEIRNFREVLLFLLRILIGWHLMYGGVVKLMNPTWSSYDFLIHSYGFMSGISQWIVENEVVLKVVDFLNAWGLTLIGIGLIIGLFTITAARAGAVLLFLYFLVNPPVIGNEYFNLLEGHYLIINKILIESVTLLVISFFTEIKIYGLDMFFVKKNNY